MWLRETDWYPTDIFFRRRSAVTKARINGPVMTRYRDGKREYREMTKEEFLDHWESKQF